MHSKPSTALTVDMGAKQITLLIVKCLPYKHGDLRLLPRSYIKSWTQRHTLEMPVLERLRGTETHLPDSLHSLFEEFENREILSPKNGD